MLSSSLSTNIKLVVSPKNKGVPHVPINSEQKATITTKSKDFKKLIIIHFDLCKKK